MNRYPLFPKEFSVPTRDVLASPRPQELLSVDARPRGAGCVVLEVVGHVDTFTAPLLRACLRTQLSRPGLRELTLDVGGVEFLGAAGVSAVAEARRRCRERGLRFRLRSHGRRQVLRPLELAGVVDGPTAHTCP